MFASFVIENIIVAAVYFSHNPFALSIAEFTDAFLIFFFFFSLYSSWVILGQTYHICKTFQSTWMYRGASKDAETLGFSRRIAFYSLLWTMLNDGFVSIMFGWSWLWVPVDNIFYIHPLQLLLVGQSG